MTVQYHLLMVHQPERQDVQDFYDIAAIIHRLAPDIKVFIANNESKCPVTRRQAEALPTLVFSPGPLDVFRPGRGKIYAGHPYLKVEQMNRLAAAGIDVPPFISGEAAAIDTIGDWGPLVLVKSNKPGASLGAGIELRRTQDVIAEFKTNAALASDELFIQKYIYTGEFPANYRVHSLFGKSLLSYLKLSTALGPRPDGSDASLGDVCIQPRFKTGQTHKLAYDLDVLMLTMRIYEAFPEIPLQGVDIVREQDSGKLYVLEINPGGNTWIFSYGSREARYTQSVMKSLGLSDLKQPFDAFTIAAKELIDKTRAGAE